MTGTAHHTQLGVLLVALNEMHLQTKTKAIQNVLLKILQTFYLGIIICYIIIYYLFSWNQFRAQF